VEYVRPRLPGAVRLLLPNERAMVKDCCAYQAVSNTTRHLPDLTRRIQAAYTVIEEIVEGFVEGFF
jgi:hypothetical protein